MRSSNSKQLSLIPQRSNKRFFGGSLLVGRRKTRRPVNCKEAVHFVLRSQFAMGRNSFRTTKNHIAIELILKKAARKYGIRIYRQAIQFNHIHLILKVPSRYAYKCFISIISGKIASAVMSYMSFKNFLKSLSLSGRGEGLLIRLHPGQAFWDYRPFSRILFWGKDYKTAYNYLIQNTLEALGFVKYKPRKINYAYVNLGRESPRASTRAGEGSKNCLKEGVIRS
ncbi:MAG: transposase [Moraxellaceae bacterium]|nr:transposase [Pseudobdellovibrionaceae bacterium]